MKRFMMMAALAVIPFVMSAQAQLTTKKMKIEDFTEKTTKIVFSGNVFLDSELESAIKDNWRISPYEFCSMDDYETLKGNGDYYFLMPVKGKFRKEAEGGIEMLSVVKGGTGADKGLNKMLEVITVPFRSAEYPSGREFVFLPAIIDIIQEHILASMDKDISAYGGLANYSNDIAATKGMNIVFSEDDISPTVGEAEIETLFGKAATLISEEEADALMENRTHGTVVSYVVAPYEPQPGSYCYKLLIGTGDHKLYYFRKHKISEKTGSGFLTEDIKRINGR